MNDALGRGGVAFDKSAARARAVDGYARSDVEIAARVQCSSHAGQRLRVSSGGQRDNVVARERVGFGDCRAQGADAVARRRFANAVAGSDVLHVGGRINNKSCGGCGITGTANRE